MSESAISRHFFVGGKENQKATIALFSGGRA